MNIKYIGRTIQAPGFDNQPSVTLSVLGDDGRAFSLTTPKIMSDGYGGVISEPGATEEEIANCPPLVAHVFNTLKARPTVTDCKAEFISQRSVFIIDDEVITPETALEHLSEDLAAFVNAVYSFDNAAWAKKWRALKEGIGQGQSAPLTQEQADEAVRRAALREIVREFDDRIDALVAGYPARVRETWPHQEAEARAWLVDNFAATPTLDGIVERSGRDKAALVDSIITKADYFKRESGRALGDMQAALAALG